MKGGGNQVRNWGRMKPWSEKRDLVVVGNDMSVRIGIDEERLL